jgi:hypothetical protein
MKYLKIVLYVIGYTILLILIAGQILGILGSTNPSVIIGKSSLILAVGLFFAIKWQRKKRKKYEHDLNAQNDKD